ncbi:hypothetical protein [Cronobacter sp. JZ38]|uniref:hypothetical protein n=1 Tax=Cronobacter sp. JZ38 TaxID=1906275 RepID=UPI001555C381|nr:hypothetical protein [Cronobacter sp. JZ38]
MGKRCAYLPYIPQEARQAVKRSTPVARAMPSTAMTAMPSTAMMSPLSEWEKGTPRLAKSSQQP